MTKILFTGERGQLARKIMEYVGGESIANVDDSYRQNCGGHHPWKELDVTNKLLFREAVEKSQPTMIVHSAAVVNTDKCKNDPQRCVDVNLMGTQNVLDVGQEFDVPVVYFSTTATYDPSDDCPRPFTEFSRQRPPTLYGITKYAGEMLVTGQSKIPWMVIRPCFIFGDPPYDHSSQLCRVAVHTVLKHKWPEKAGSIPLVTLDPFASKDYMRVEDFASAVVELIREPHWGQAFNVSYGEDKPMGWYFNELESALNMELDMEWDPESDYMKDHVVSSERLRAVTNWQPDITKLEGVQWLAKRAIEYVERCKNEQDVLLYV